MFLKNELPLISYKTTLNEKGINSNQRVLQGAAFLQ